MDVPRPDGPDVNRGTDVFIGCWTLTAFVFVVLSFRFGAKAWVAWVVPAVSRPERVWGLEDFFFGLGYAFDMGHMAMVWKSYQWGLGRHFFYLSPFEKNQAMKWDFVSQPLAVSAAMISRTGVICFLYFCFGRRRRGLSIIVLTFLVVQVVANLVTVLQIFLQCGPHPYRLVNRAAYFHYMWDVLPEDGSVVCQAPTVQATVGYVQGGFNTTIDLALVYLAGLEVWQFMFRASRRDQQHSFMTRFRKLDSRVKSQRLWQTLLLCGPLLLSAVASIVKTYLLSALGSRLDFTWNIVPFVLWVKIENYCIPIAATAPVFRLFIRSFIDQRAIEASYGTSGIDQKNSKIPHKLELSQSRNRSEAQHGDRGFRELDEITETNGSVHGSEIDLVPQNGGSMVIEVKREYHVHVEEQKGNHTSLAQPK